MVCKIRSNIIFLSRVVVIVAMLSGLVFGQNITFIGSIKSDLYAPTYLEIYDGGLAVLETYTGEIKEFSPDGLLSQKLYFNNKASGLTRIGDHRYLICESVQSKIFMVDMLSKEESDFLSEKDGLKQPIDLLYYNASIYVLDAKRRSILKFNSDGLFSDEIILLDDSQQTLSPITCFDYNPDLDRFYLLDQIKSMVYIIKSDGSYLGAFGAFGYNGGEFTRGGEIKISPTGHILISDRYQGQILIFDYDGEFVGQITGNKDGPLSFEIPTGIDVDENGVVYISSTTRPGIDIYHVNFGALGSKLVVAGQYFPDDLAELKADEVRLTAYSRGGSKIESIYGFYFELYDKPGLTNPIENSEIVPPVMNTDSVLNNDLITGTWIPKNSLTAEHTYYWRSRLQTTDTISNWTALRSFTVVSLPDKFQLNQNYPNPFNPSTTISFTLPDKMEINLEIFNIIGQRIRVLANNIFEAGMQKVVWDGKDDFGNDVVSGVYFYRLRAEGYSDNKKMVLIR